nr:capsid protein [Aspergillus terreus chrysovirus 1]
MDFNIKKYDEKTSLFKAVRSEGPAVKRATMRQRQFTTWDAATLEGAGTEVERVVRDAKDLAGMANYFHANYIGAMEYISQPQFRIGYHVYGDVDRDPVLGENTCSINYDLAWHKLEVEGELYTGVAKQVFASKLLEDIERSGLTYRDEVAKFTRWNRTDVQRLPNEDMRTLITLLKAVVVGQNKFTRLVKGFLLMFACMDTADGTLHVTRDVDQTILYGPATVINAFRVPRRSYIWCSEPASDQYVATLLCMAEAYPPPCVGNSHVTVPADGDSVYLVADGQNTSPTIDCHLNPGAIYSSILRYANDVGVMDDIQGAMTCAASLFENRYFAKIGLPKVLSFCDLLIPGLEKPAGAGAPKPFVTAAQGRVIGRVHQMLGFMVAKDLISAAVMSTKPGFNPYDSIRSYLSAQEQVVSQMGYRYSDLSLLEITPQMLYLTRLSQDDCDDIASLPIFESLWLCDGAKKGVQNGVLQAIKTGVKDASDDTNTKDVLIDEMRKGGIVDRLQDLPTGRFTTEGCAVESMRCITPRKPRRLWQEVHRVFECSHKPTDYTPKRKARIGKEPIPTSPRRVPVASLFRESPDNGRKQVKWESPPSYTSESKSSDYVASPPVSEHRRRTSSLQGQTQPIPFMSRVAQLATGVPVKGDASSKVGVDIEEAVRLRLGGDIPKSDLLDLGLEGNETLSDVARKYAIKHIEDGVLTEHMPLRREAMKQLLLLKGGPATAVDFAVTVAAETDTLFQLWHAASLGRYVDHLENSGAATGIKNINVPAGLEGHYARLGRIVAVQRVTGSGGDEAYNAMRDMKGKWSGDIYTAPKKGLRHVANSRPWLDLLDEHGVDQGEIGSPSEVKAMNVSMRVALAIVYARNPTLSYDVLKTVSEWLAGTTVDLFPSNVVTSDMMGLGEPYELPYRKGDTSHEDRKYQRQDSKYLVMACRVTRAIFARSTVHDLKGWFTLPQSDLKALNNMYKTWPGQ